MWLVIMKQNGCYLLSVLLYAVEYKYLKHYIVENELPFCPSVI